jgi:hypothetical protein
MTATATAIPEARRIPPEEFGRDHHSTLLYIETRCVDSDGAPKREQMRCHPDRHPHYQTRMQVLMGWKDEYQTRLANGAREPNHDDWDCLEDLEAAGLLISVGTGFNPQYKLTDAGWAEAGRLRRARAERPR